MTSSHRAESTGTKMPAAFLGPSPRGILSALIPEPSFPEQTLKKNQVCKDLASHLNIAI